MGIQMSEHPADVVVAGHICLDVIPTFPERVGSLNSILTPGKLVNVGPVVTATGGAVSNTGLALHRLGIRTRLMGKIGGDLFGSAILDIVRSHDESLVEGMIVSEDEASSYTVVISPPGVDRIFLHCPGANDTFGATDVDITAAAGARIFHFGYPPLMRRMYQAGGEELSGVMRQAKHAGLITSLDMAYPDPDSEAGRVAWEPLLERVLPDVDFFLPSLEEILFMMERPRFDALMAAGPLMEQVDGALLRDVAARLIDMGVAVVVLKLGDQGLYLRTTGDRKRLDSLDLLRPLERWLDQELLAPGFRTKVVGATGAGDCAIAGFLAGIMKGLSPADTLIGAAAVGACNVESADATSGVPHWDVVWQRIRQGWPRLETSLRLDGWQWDSHRFIWLGPGR